MAKGLDADKRSVWFTDSNLPELPAELGRKVALYEDNVVFEELMRIAADWAERNGYQ